jgi:hypothetical protein
VTSDRDHFTKHVLHLNKKGKTQVAISIMSSIKEIFKKQKKNPNKMNREEELKLGVNIVTNNVDNDGNQIIHEEQLNRRDEVQTVGANSLNIMWLMWLFMQNNQIEETMIKQKELILLKAMWIRMVIWLFMKNNQTEETKIKQKELILEATM